MGGYPTQCLLIEAVIRAACEEHMKQMSFCFLTPSFLPHFTCVTLAIRISLSFKDVSYLFIYLFRAGEGGRERERERLRERERDPLLLVHTPAWDQTCNPGRYPDWELNRWSFTWWNHSQQTEPHQSGQPSGSTHIQTFAGCSNKKPLLFPT